MPSAPEPPVAVYAGLAALPAPARALFGSALFDSEDWFRVSVEAALPARAAPAFVCIGAPAAPMALVPMLMPILAPKRGGGQACGAFTTPYSCAWRPLLAEGADARAVGRALALWCRSWGTVRLDCLALEDAFWPALLAGARQAGLVALPFDHFGNWRAAAPHGWAAYLAQRPGHVREALRRRGRKLAAQGATLFVVQGEAGLADGLAAYEAVYAASWKEPEPYPRFNGALMRACAARGWLRLGLLRQGEQVFAAQFWVVQGSTATVLKLAHDAAHKAASPGTVLTGLMIERLLTQEGVTTLDFGRGDDPYKQAWTDTRVQRHGLVLANPLDPAGAVAILRHGARALVRQGRKAASARRSG